MYIHLCENRSSIQSLTLTRSAMTMCCTSISSVLWAHVTETTFFCESVIPFHDCVLTSGNWHSLEVCWPGARVALIPGRSHLQYLIACSMQIQRGRAREIWSRLVTSGRRRVATWGVVPDKETLSSFSYYQSKGWRAARQHQYCSLFMLPGMVRHEAGVITVYPLST